MFMLDNQPLCFKVAFSLFYCLGCDFEVTFLSIELNVKC